MSLGKAAVIALLGLLMVFAVLAVLVGILTIFKLVFSIKIEKKPVSASESEISEEDDDEIIAVISAAIACIDNEESAKAPFYIKSIRKLK